LGVRQRWCSSEPQQLGGEEDALGQHLFLPNTFADALAQLSRIDILVLADRHTVAEANQHLEATIARCKPLVVEATCTAAAAALIATAVERDCKVVDRSTLILERACVCSREWTGQAVPRDRLSAALQALNGSLSR
jgi:shikimate 5-dehydrogenase